MELERLQELLSSLEALLFIYGEPLPRKRAVKLLDIKEEEFDAVLAEFKRQLDHGDRGLTLVLDGEKVQLVTKPQFSKFLEGFVKEELSEDLTPASLETLSIIAYLGPVSRNRIEYLRGVNSIFTLRSLLLRGLIERSSHPKNPNTYLYQPSFKFLSHIGAERKEKLPEYEKFQSLLVKFETGNGEQQS